MQYLQKLRFMFCFWFQLFETSAQDETECDNVEAIFLTLAHKLKNHRPFMTSPLSPIRGNVPVEASHRADVLALTYRDEVPAVSYRCWC